MAGKHDLKTRQMTSKTKNPWASEEKRSIYPRCWDISGHLELKAWLSAFDVHFNGVKDSDNGAVELKKGFFIALIC